jgi:LDH2 family malate/lactate/ureidoglycolate dehydrogenase
MLGNAPIGFGIPAGDHDPIIFDASMTQTSASGVKLAATQGQQVPAGFLLDAHGEPTTDASAFPASGHMTHDSQMARGTLLPLGGSHKAYGLIFIISLLSAVLADSEAPWDGGAIVGGAPADPSHRYGSTYMVIDPAAFLGVDEFRRRVDAFIDDLKASPTKAGVDEILYPGELSQRLKRERRAAGRFLLPETHYHELAKLAEELGLSAALR